MGATIASDEDMDWGYVLVDEHAPDYETARELLRTLGREQWGMSLGSVLDHDPRRRSYKWMSDEHDEDNLMPCEPDDPERDSDWWVFDLSMNDHDLIDPVPPSEPPSRGQP